MHVLKCAPSVPIHGRTRACLITKRVELVPSTYTPEVIGRLLGSALRFVDATTGDAT